MKIKYLNAFNDNYIWLLQNHQSLIVIDPGQSIQVIDYITANQLNLDAILLTHGHDDHIGGVDDLQLTAKFPIYGTCDVATVKVDDGINFKLWDKINAEVIYTPGHTLDGICFLLNDGALTHLFCGDTLFAAGCGRVFTGDFIAMFNSLSRIKALSPDTLIYPAHEYTLKNLAFAQFIEPNNPAVIQRITIETKKLANTGITLPTVLSLELITNPFLRCDDVDLVARVGEIVGRQVTAGLDCFIQLRELRNNF